MSSEPSRSNHESDSTFSVLPPLPYLDWAESKDTLHRFCQIIGKVRLAKTPHMNHWWNVTLFVTTRGITTGPIPCDPITFSIDLDFVDHRLIINTSRGTTVSFALHDGLSVAEFYERVLSTLHRLGIHPEIFPKPYELTPDTPFPEDTEHSAYDKNAVYRWWQALSWIDGVLKEFSGRFTGKQSPVHLFWHSFDIALGRFSGRRAPDRPGASMSDRVAYSHEIISFGWWAGDSRVPAPAFYSYTAPEPAGLAERPLLPNAASWSDVGGSHMAMLMYDVLREMDDPKARLLEFLQSAYDAGATAAGWDVDGLKTVYFDGDSV